MSLAQDRRAEQDAREEKVLAIIETARGKKQKFRDARITMAHGAGGKATASLIEGLLLPAFANAALDELGDAGYVPTQAGTLALSTDSYVVRPLTFPGGCIGELAINGTANDLACAGARPLALTLGMILEEGLESTVLREQVAAMAAGAAAAGVTIVTGDTKVVERGSADGMYLNTAGVGLRDERATLSPSALRPGDQLLLSGPIGAHGMAIMLARGEFELESEIRSDTRCLWPMVDAMLEAAGPHLRCLRDATRGGVASVLNELARASGVAMVVREASVPVDPNVAGAAELLGLDPMQIANEGVLVAAVAPEGAGAALEAMKNVAGGQRAVLIGDVKTDPTGMVLVETGFGGRRVCDQLVGDPLPRIC